LIGREIAVFVGLALIWGTTWAVIRLGLGSVPPLTGAAIRFTVAALVLFLVARVRGVRLGALGVERKLWLASGLLTFALSYGIVYWAEQKVPSALAAVLFATFPLWVALLGHRFLPGERLTPRAVLGVVLGFVGIVVIFSADLDAIEPGLAVSAAVFLISPLSAALGNLLLKLWGHEVPALSLAAGPMLVGAVLLGVAAVIFEPHLPILWDARGIGSILYLALVGSALAFSLYYWLLSRWPTLRLAMLTYLSPLVAVTLGVLLFDEALTGRMLTGSGLVLGGVAVALARRG
jgi:drug/metabolite transporter (DMT)-like permease